MLNFRLVLSKFQRKSLLIALSKGTKKGNLTVVNRIKTILAVVEEVPFSQIAKILRVSEEGIRQWVINYLSSGLRAITFLKKQPGRPSKLSKTPRKRLKQWIIDGPQNAGFPGACWRSPMIQELIFQKFGVLYNVKYLSELLKNMGHSYQKARFAVGGKDPENQEKRQKWLEQTWPEILAEGQEKGAYLLFGDEVSFPQWGSLTYTWAPIGQQPTVPTSGVRKGYKVFGLIDYFSGFFFYKTQESRLNSETYKAFLWEVLAKTRKPIILIQDGASYHVSKATRLFFEQFQHRLTVYQLPGYSPDFNPIEKLWKNVKKNEIHLHYFPTFDSLKHKVEEALTHFSNRQKEILELFGFYEEKKIA